jgi:hypothetical protein
MHAPQSQTRRPAQRCAGFFMRVGVMCMLSVAGCALPALAQVRASGDYLARMDANRDGRIALVEYQDWLSYAFDAMDRNRDGLLSPGELPGGRGQPLARSEHRARLAAAFARQDRNHDGFLDARELATPPQ